MRDRTSQGLKNFRVVDQERNPTSPEAGHVPQFPLFYTLWPYMYADFSQLPCVQNHFSLLLLLRCLRFSPSRTQGRSLYIKLVPPAKTSSEKANCACLASLVRCYSIACRHRTSGHFTPGDICLQLPLADDVLDAGLRETKAKKAISGVTSGIMQYARNSKLQGNTICEAPCPKSQVVFGKVR